MRKSHSGSLMPSPSGISSISDGGKSKCSFKPPPLRLRLRDKAISSKSSATRAASRSSLSSPQRSTSMCSDQLNRFSKRNNNKPSLPELSSTRLACLRTSRPSPCAAPITSPSSSSPSRSLACGSPRRSAGYNQSGNGNGARSVTGKSTTLPGSNKAWRKARSKAASFFFNEFGSGRNAKCASSKR